jgi:hypothetical protein
MLHHLATHTEGNDMRTVKVNKEELLTKLRENRDQHREVFLKAQDGYRQFLIKELEQRLDEAQKGMKVDRFIRLEEPEDHTSDYDRVIMMAEMSIDDEITLSDVDFGQYVMDNWAWKQAFAATAGTYTDTSGYSNYRQ